MQTTNLPSASLFYREGASDKVYYAEVKPKGEGYEVAFAYGRRGASLTTGVKTKAPVAYDVAVKVWDKLVTEKQGKGYVQEASGKVVRAAAPAAAAAGLESPGHLLLTPLEDDESMSFFIGNDAYFAQPKHDGKRLVIVKRGSLVQAFNRRNLACAFAENVRDELASYKHDITLDCEAWSDRVVAFDILYRRSDDLRSMRGADRVKILEDLNEDFSTAIELTETAFGTKRKQALFDRLTQEAAEGIVFKDGTAPWRAGRPNSRGPNRKAKFWKSVTVRVSRVGTGLQSVNMELKDARGNWVQVGSLTIANSRTLPEPGSYLEVKYLYAFPESNQLYQASELERRDDVTDADCKLSQLSYKAEE